MKITSLKMIDESTSTVFRFDEYSNGKIIRIGDSQDIPIDTFEEFVNILVKARVISVYN